MESRTFPGSDIQVKRHAQSLVCEPRDVGVPSRFVLRAGCFLHESAFAAHPQNDFLPHLPRGFCRRTATARTRESTPARSWSATLAYECGSEQCGARACPADGRTSATIAPV